METLESHSATVRRRVAKARELYRIARRNGKTVSEARYTALQAARVTFDCTRPARAILGDWGQS